APTSPTSSPSWTRGPAPRPPASPGSGGCS
ncbi:MAG: hypothetical protein AVDCRST_MAG73-2422, partial [uncultured Thermomicrobiales bacterium]